MDVFLQIFSAILKNLSMQCCNLIEYGIYCMYLKEPRQSTSDRYPQHMCLRRKKKNIYLLCPIIWNLDISFEKHSFFTYIQSSTSNSVINLQQLVACPFCDQEAMGLNPD